MQTSEEYKAEGNRAFRGAEYTAAVRYFTESLRLNPNDPLVLGNRAAAFDKLGQHERAVTDAHAALQLDPTYLKGYFRLATAMLALRRPREAYEATQRGLAIQRNNSQLRALQEQAAALLEEEDDEEEGEGETDDEEAEGETEEEDDDEEDDGERRQQTRRTEAATEASNSKTRPRMSTGDSASSFATSEPSDPVAAAEAAKARGNEQYKRGEYSTAVTLYSQAVRLMPGNATYRINRAAAALMLERAEDALEDCQSAIQAEPTLIKAHVRAAKALVMLGKLSDARRQLETAAAQPTADASVGTELASLGELEASLKSAKEALAQQGGAPAREALRLMTGLAQRCPCSEAVACLQMEALLRARPEQGAQQVVAESARWLRKASDNPDLLCVRGKGLYRTGQLEAALKHFSEALRQDPDHAASKQMRALLKQLEGAKKAGNEAFAAGRFAEAIERYTEALAIDPENSDVNVTFYTNRATARFKIREYAASIKDCDDALAAAPRHIKALLRRAACKLELEDYQGAIGDYEEAQSLEPEDQTIRQGLRNAKVELKKSQRKDLYKVLGVTKHATDHEIKKAYKKKALECHPDRMTNASDDDKAVAEKRFKEVGEAFEILSDPQKKQRWDNGETLDELNGNGGGGGGRGGGFGGIDPSDLFRAYAARGGGGGFRGGF